MKLNIAITGAIKNDTVVAKSTSSFRLSPNCMITINEPTTSIIRNSEYFFLERSAIPGFFSNSKRVVLAKEREYPSNTAIMVPNITLNADAEIMMLLH